MWVVPVLIWLVVSFYEGILMNAEELEHAISKLNVADKLALVENIWDGIAQSDEALPLPQWQKDELNERLALYEQGKLETKSWDEVQKTLRQKYS